MSSHKESMKIFGNRTEFECRHCNALEPQINLELLKSKRFSGLQFQYRITLGLDVRDEIYSLFTSVKIPPQKKKHIRTILRGNHCITVTYDEFDLLIIYLTRLAVHIILRRIVILLVNNTSKLVMVKKKRSWPNLMY